MRPLLCLLVLLSVLAPLGEVGITTIPADAESQLVAPRADRGAVPTPSPIATDVDLVVVGHAVTPRRSEVVRSTSVPRTRALRDHLLERPLGARAPPA